MSAWFPKLVPHPSHTMRTPNFGDPYRKKCTDCGITDLQDDVEKACVKAPTVERIAELEAALKDIKDICSGDRNPRWGDQFAVTISRNRIMDICDSVMNRETSS